MASFESEAPTLNVDEGSISDTQSFTGEHSEEIWRHRGLDWESDEVLQPICNNLLVNEGALASFANVIKMALFTNEGVPLNLHSPDIYGWNASPTLAQFIRILHEAWHKMATARLEYSDEPSFGKIHLPVMAEIFESRSIAVSPTALQ
ncbi:uncharacterized protein L199_005582 [Kwoniella botswanensis]|uniref:uncharacterized protein n=1 Tax=Kwoniella botswanensis TaxID=1268659 RepID=UPI00315C80D4